MVVKAALYIVLPYQCTRDMRGSLTTPTTRSLTARFKTRWFDMVLSSLKGSFWIATNTRTFPAIVMAARMANTGTLDNGTAISYGSPVVGVTWVVLARVETLAR